jgi:hypothetical protein
VIYSYDAIDFELEQIDYAIASIYDETGTDYLYTEYHLRTESIWNPAATQDTSALHPPPAAQSMVNLMSRLSAPRKVLQILTPNHDPNTNGGAAIFFPSRPERQRRRWDRGPGRRSLLDGREERPDRDWPARDRHDGRENGSRDA